MYTKNEYPTVTILKLIKSPAHFYLRTIQVTFAASQNICSRLPSRKSQIFQ